jgi:small subunit ribosomal protein S17
MAEENEETTEPTVDETVETPAEEVVEATPDATENAADAGPVDEVEGGEASDEDEATEAAETGPTLTRKEQRTAARHVEASKRPARTVEERIADRAAERKRKAAQRTRRREKAKVARAAGEKGPAKTQSTAEHGPGRPKTRQGLVVSSKADKTITVRVDTARRHRRYEKIVRSSSTLHAHDESNDANEGDLVTIIESRPLSKLKRWRLVEVLERAK